jgi:hypothetical protein
MSDFYHMMSGSSRISHAAPAILGEGSIAQTPASPGFA